MNYDRSRPLNSGVPTERAKEHEGAAMFMRSTPQPRIDGLLVTKTERIRRKSKSEASRRENETRQGQKRAAEEEEFS